jgi:hypothetical protein
MLWWFIIAGTKECFQGHTHPQPPIQLHLQAQGIVTYSFEASAWSARPRGAPGGLFRRRKTWLWHLWCQLCFVIRLLKISIETVKLVVCNQFSWILLYIVKHFIIHVSLIVVWTKPKLMVVGARTTLVQWTPDTIGYCRKALVIVRTILTLYWGRNVGIFAKERKGFPRRTLNC